MRTPDDDVTIVAPQRVRDLVLGLLVVVGAHGRRIEVVGQLGQRMVGALQQAHVAAVRVHGDEAMQKAGFILDALGPAVQEQDAGR